MEPVGSRDPAKDIRVLEVGTLRTDVTTPTVTPSSSSLSPPPPFPLFLCNNKEEKDRGRREEGPRAREVSFTTI